MRKNKAKRLKKIHVWPSVILMIFVLLIIMISMVTTYAVVIFNTVESKLNQVYKNAAVVVQLFDEQEEQDYAKKQKEVEKTLKVLEDITSVCVMQGDQLIWQVGDGDLKNKIPITDHGDDASKLYLDTSDEEGFLVIEDGDFEIQYEQLVESLLQKHDLLSWFDMDKNHEVVAAQGIWYEHSLDSNYSVCIKSKIELEANEIFLYFIILLGLVFMICLIFILILVNTIRLVLNQKHVTRLYYTDTETGEHNWQYFLAHAKKILKPRNRANHSYAMVHLRTEKYRNYCTCYGVQDGIQLVSDFQHLLGRMIKKKELVARKEKGDFGLLLLYQTEEELFQRLQDMMARLSAMKLDRKINFSAGICYVEQDETAPDELYNRAATARFSLGEDSVEKICVFSHVMLEQLKWEQKVEEDMERARHNHEFQVYLQPKYSTTEEKISAAEALVRWIHPTEGFVPPYRFIPIFEKNGFILKLDDYMISEVAKLQAQWLKEGKEIVPISVNVSRAHFTREDLAEHICQLVDAYHVPHEYIELELTESAFFDDKNTIIRIVNQMKELGFSVSMDDFGAGYSSLNSLKELSVDIVKLDAEFFRGNDEEGKGKVIIREAIRLAKELEMRIVAEGIETREQVDFLAQEECDLIQGYYFAKPMPVDEFVNEAFSS